MTCGLDCIHYTCSCGRLKSMMDAGLFKRYVPELSPEVSNAIGNGEELAKLMALKCANVDMEKFNNEE